MVTKSLAGNRTNSVADNSVTELPPLDAPVTGGDLAFHYHSSGHRAVPADWKAFLDFAERHFHRPTAR